MPLKSSEEKKKPTRLDFDCAKTTSLHLAIGRLDNIASVQESQKPLVHMFIQKVDNKICNANLEQSREIGCFGHVFCQLG